ncbi:hypothetical protein D3C77_447540 [compost metagenome]
MAAGDLVKVGHVVQVGQGDSNQINHSGEAFSMTNVGALIINFPRSTNYRSLNSPPE